MRRGVDAARHARGDDDAFLAETRGDVLGDPPAIGRGVAGADHRDDRRGEPFAAAEQQQHRRRVVDGGEGAGIERLAPAHRPSADAVERRQLLLGGGAGRRGEAVAAEPRHRVERCPGRAEAAQQRIKRDRADRLGTRQAQPVEALLRVELAGGQRAPQLLVKEMRLSVPATMRRMFSWWRMITSTTRPVISIARWRSRVRSA